MTLRGLKVRLYTDSPDPETTVEVKDHIERGETGGDGPRRAERQGAREEKVRGGWNFLHETMKVLHYAGVGELEASGWVASCVMYGIEEQTRWLEECVPDEMRRYGRSTSLESESDFTPRNQNKN